MKKTIKVLSILLATALLVIMIAIPVVNAVDDPTSTVDDLFNGGGDVDTSGLSGVGANIVSIITTIGIIVAVVVLLVLGIKYMMGSASEKAEYKKTMIPYLVGAVLIFGASAIAKAVVAMSSTITSGT